MGQAPVRPVRICQELPKIRTSRRVQLTVRRWDTTHRTRARRGRRQPTVRSTRATYQQQLRKPTTPTNLALLSPHPAKVVVPPFCVDLLFVLDFVGSFEIILGIHLFSCISIIGLILRSFPQSGGLQQPSVLTPHPTRPDNPSVATEYFWIW